MKPTLYVVATPIGNLRDISPRALDVLRNANTIAAEDTRITRRLLDHYGISGKLIALHEHNEERAAAQVLQILEGGADVAVVSDAGTPAISDPGARVVSRVRAAGHPVSPLPGASAAVAALSISGFQVPHFLFYGFLPARSAARRQALAALVALPFTLVFYEAPHRIAACLDDLASTLGTSRRVLIARELTKLFEETQVCMLAEAGHWVCADSHREQGEFVLVVEGVAAASGDASEVEKVLATLLEAVPLKQAVALTVKLTGAKKNEVYDMALHMRDER